MGWPQILIIVLFAMDVGVTLAKHGEPRTGKYSFWITLFCDAVLVLILWYGGFWR